MQIVHNTGDIIKPCICIDEYEQFVEATTYIYQTVYSTIYNWETDSLRLKCSKSDRQQVFPVQWLTEVTREWHPNFVIISLDPED